MQELFKPIYYIYKYPGKYPCTKYICVYGKDESDYYKDGLLKTITVDVELNYITKENHIWTNISPSAFSKKPWEQGIKPYYKEVTEVKFNKKFTLVLTNIINCINIKI